MILWEKGNGSYFMRSASLLSTSWSRVTALSFRALACVPCPFSFPDLLLPKEANLTQGQFPANNWALFQRNVVGTVLVSKCPLRDLEVWSVPTCHRAPPHTVLRWLLPSFRDWADRKGKRSCTAHTQSLLLLQPELNAFMALGLDPTSDLWWVVLHEDLSILKDQRKCNGNVCLVFLGRCQQDISPGSTPKEKALVLSELFSSWDQLVNSKPLVLWASLATSLLLEGSLGLLSKKSLLISSCLLTQCDI